MATLEIPKCKHCKKQMRLLRERTSAKKKPIFICTDCDGRLSLYARFDGDLPRK